MGLRRIGRILGVAGARPAKALFSKASLLKRLSSQKPLFFNYSSPRVNSGGLARGAETAPGIGCIFLTLFSK
jgi:hypothetical protein